MKTKAVLIIAVMVALTGCTQLPPTITAVTAFYSDERVVELEVHAVGKRLSFDWNTGDGGRAVGQNPIYEYAEYGEYLVTVTATDSRGQSCEYVLPIVVDRGQVGYYENVVPEYPWAWTGPLEVEDES